jgi:dTDP-4-amino-4,6-dideoxygalactose transaminase
MKVPFNDLGAQYRRLKGPIDRALARVLESGWYVGGPPVDSFEQAFARYSGATHAVGVANGTDALALALRALGIEPGDEVVIPSVSAYPTTVGVVLAQAVPVFADVRLEDGLLDPAALEAQITTETRAVVPVHLYGTPCDLDAIGAVCRKHGLALVEDCAQAHGATWNGNAAGTFGAAASWSFYPTKNLGAVGDAGAITTGSGEVAAKLKRLRNYGQQNRYEHLELGFNSRLDPLQAALLEVKLASLPQELARRRAIAARYDAAFAGHPALSPMRVDPRAVSARHLYPVRLRDPARRPELQAHLAAAQIETLVHYPIAMPDQRATRPEWVRGEFPNGRALCASEVSLPIHPELDDAQVAHVTLAVAAWS